MITKFAPTSHRPSQQIDTNYLDDTSKDAIYGIRRIAYTSHLKQEREELRKEEAFAHKSYLI